MNLRKYKEKLEHIQELREENNRLQEKLKKIGSQEIKKLEEIEVAVAELYICQNRNEMDTQNRIVTEYIHSEIKKLISEKKENGKHFRRTHDK